MAGITNLAKAYYIGLFKHEILAAMEPPKLFARLHLPYGVLHKIMTYEGSGKFTVTFDVDEDCVGQGPWDAFVIDSDGEELCKCNNSFYGPFSKGSTITITANLM